MSKTVGQLYSQSYKKSFEASLLCAWHRVVVQIIEVGRWHHWLLFRDRLGARAFFKSSTGESPIRKRFARCLPINPAGCRKLTRPFRSSCQFFIILYP